MRETMQRIADAIEAKFPNRFDVTVQADSVLIHNRWSGARWMIETPADAEFWGIDWNEATRTMTVITRAPTQNTAIMTSFTRD